MGRGQSLPKEMWQEEAHKTQIAFVEWMLREQHILPAGSCCSLLFFPFGQLFNELAIKDLFFAHQHDSVGAGKLGGRHSM